MEVTCADEADMPSAKVTFTVGKKEDAATKLCESVATSLEGKRIPGFNGMEIATKLCESVAASLEGKKISGFNGVKNAVKTSLEEGLTRILTPKQGNG
ncbi:hypothetical protein T484DRAFT_1815475 [Baffinella frigidus]|nr:hypothetical protein T484DRAFT_1815475 [Cryptophyta sp. CCMP2293]